MLDIHSVMQSLAERRLIFNLEADFQHELAWHIKEVIPNCKVRLEYKPFPYEGVYLDIWLPTLCTAIELKYFTREIDIEVNRERFVLSNQGSQPLSRYDFVKDIARLERVVADNAACTSGYAILLTNDASYWKSPAAQWRTTMDAHFRLHEGRSLTGDLKWKDGTNPRTIAKREEPIFLAGSYNVNWQDYSEILNQKQSKFRYLVATVGG